MVPESWCVHIEVQQVCVYDADLHHQFLFYGWGCIFWQAIALQYGKRPVYLMSLLMNVIILAAAPLCTTSGPYLANRILLGFFGSPVESLAEISGDHGNWLSGGAGNRLRRCVGTPGSEAFAKTLLQSVFGV